MAELQDGFPPGWECKYDGKTGRSFFINHITKVTTWDDPRRRQSRHYHGTPRQHFSSVQVEHIPLQHGSPDLKRNYVYPSNPTPIPAFQMPSNMSPKNGPFQDMRSVIRMSPLAVRSSKLQDTSLIQQTDTDEAVAKISAMFPTVSETHIRMLLNKYHGREAVVISALQVEKHPITTPGPHATPPPQRDIHAPLAKPALRPHSGSPRADAWRSSPRPHSSPKLKLSCRYMKSVFPEADETIILDILQNNDNNIQKTSEALKDMGFNKKDTVKIAKEKMEAKIEGKKESEEKLKIKKFPVPQPKIKTSEEKAELKFKLQAQYNDVAEYLINIALESVNFDENRASQILKIMIQEDSEASNKRKEENGITETDATTPTNIIPVPENISIPVSQSRQSIKSLLKEKNEKDVSSFRRFFDKTLSKPPNLLPTKGHNPEITKGPNDGLLLLDYVDWQGPQGLAKGPNKKLLSNRTYSPKGSNAELRKGPKFGLAKGSIYSQLKAVIIGESRSK